jgi:hypothetical protein
VKGVFHVKPEPPRSGARVRWVGHSAALTAEEEASLGWPLRVGDEGTVAAVPCAGPDLWPVKVTWDRDGVTRTMFAGEVTSA